MQKTYHSFHGVSDEPWYDTNGRKIQAHGGQVQKFTVNGKEKWYWIGEDKTYGYRPCGGIHMYSSDDLYNWKDEGVILRTMETMEEFEDPYFKTLYGSLSMEEKKKIFIDLDKHNCVIERPKILYNEKTGKGLLRHIVTKIGIQTNELMCILVINGKELPKEKELVEEVVSNFSNVKTIIKNVNEKNTNVILGRENICLYGNGYIKDKLGDYVFKISPLSFYQVNPVQAKILYEKAIEEAKITDDDVVFDLYCGIGTISLFMSKYAKKVYGIEIVEEAVKMAKENAKLNQINNTEFVAGDVEMVLDDLIRKEKVTPNIVMVDPPRKGLDDETIGNVLKILPKRMVYISCNPATLVRDLAKLEKCYEIISIQPVDMFPFTSHVECVAVLQLKQDR